MFLLSYFLSPMILKRIVSSEHIYEAAISYLNWRVFGAFFSFSAVIFRAFFLGTTQTKTLTLNSIVMVLSNVVFNYILIFGKFGFPALGIAGAAIGSSLAELVSLIFFILYTRYRIDCRKFGLDADYVTVFQETYDTDKYETLHLMGHKRVWPYRFDAQERALRGGMRGVAFSALLGLSDFRKDALASALHVYYLQRKYPHAEMSLSCPRLRPIINNDKINPLDVHEKQLCQIICAYRIFLPFVGITVSSRESASFRDGIVKIAATKVSAGVSTGIGDHDSKYNGKENEEPQGDEQFEINDSRSLDKMYQDIAEEGLQPVLNDYLYIG